MGDKIPNIEHFLEPPPIAKPLFSRRPHLHLENLGPPQYLICYNFWYKISNGTSNGDQYSTYFRTILRDTINMKLVFNMVVIN